MTIGLDSVIVRDSEPIATTLDDQVVMLSVRANAYVGLNDVGTEIWHMIEQPRRVADICRRLAETYDESGDTVAREVLEFLEGLLERGLVKIVEQPA
jgi:hypothetical protein